jgi:hypothetical protein
MAVFRDLGRVLRPVIILGGLVGLATVLKLRT